MSNLNNSIIGLMINMIDLHSYKKCNTFQQNLVFGKALISVSRHPFFSHLINNGYAYYKYILKEWY